MNAKLPYRNPRDFVPHQSPIQREARALGDPTRYKLFRYIADARRPVYITELEEFLAVNHNAVRQHLAILKDALLVLEESEKRYTPGRPRLTYSFNSEHLGAWGTESPYKKVAMLLTTVIKSGRSAHEVGRSEGVRRAQRPSNHADLLQILDEELRFEGFKPLHKPGELECDIELQNCPYKEVAILDPNTICQLHEGILEGLVTQLEEHATVRLVVRDPRRAGCCVKLRRSEFERTSS